MINLPQIAKNDTYKIKAYSICNKRASEKALSLYDIRTEIIHWASLPSIYTGLNNTPFLLQETTTNTIKKLINLSLINRDFRCNTLVTLTNMPNFQNLLSYRTLPIITLETSNNIPIKFKTFEIKKTILNLFSPNNLCKNITNQSNMHKYLMDNDDDNFFLTKILDTNVNLKAYADYLNTVTTTFDFNSEIIQKQIFYLCTTDIGQIIVNNHFNKIEELRTNLNTLYKICKNKYAGNLLLNNIHNVNLHNIDQYLNFLCINSEIAYSFCQKNINIFIVNNKFKEHLKFIIHHCITQDDFNFVQEYMHQIENICVAYIPTLNSFQLYNRIFEFIIKIYTTSTDTQKLNIKDYLSNPNDNIIIELLKLKYDNSIQINFINVLQDNLPEIAEQNINNLFSIVDKYTTIDDIQQKKLLTFLNSYNEFITINLLNIILDFGFIEFVEQHIKILPYIDSIKLSLIFQNLSNSDKKDAIESLFPNEIFAIDLDELAEILAQD